VVRRFLRPTLGYVFVNTNEVVPWDTWSTSRKGQRRHGDGPVRLENTRASGIQISGPARNLHGAC